MAIFNFNRSKMKALDRAFQDLKDNINNPDSSERIHAVDSIRENAEDIFKYKFPEIGLVNTNDGSPLFVMSVYPEETVVDKMIHSIATGNTNDISNLWRKNKVWNIEIDARILDDHIVSLTGSELTAIFLHEVGHITQSNSIPQRITNVLQYEIAKGGTTTRALIRDNLFNRILSLPILNACSMEKNDHIADEIKADRFAKKAGYTKDLISVFDKFKDCPQYKENDTADDAMKIMTGFTNDAFNQFKERETSLLESTLGRMEEECASPYLKNEIKSLYNYYFEGSEETSVTKESKLENFYNQAEKDEKAFVVKEFFGLGKKSLKRIDPAELDYIAVKIKSIETNTDKMMLVGYIHSKLDIVNYYLAILNNPREAKKYRVPYTEEELLNLKTLLNDYIDKTINARLPEKLDHLLIAWPDGYEG